MDKISLIDIDILGPGFTNALTSSDELLATLTTGKPVSFSEGHIPRMKALRTKKGVHPAQTLDKYADMDLSGEWLEM